VGGDEPERHALDYFRAGADAVLIDTFHDGKVGSTGLTVDFEVARRVRDTVRPGPLILAGGLNSGNVVETIQVVKLFAVDVFTGVTSAGRLDPQKVSGFLNAVY